VVQEDNCCVVGPVGSMPTMLRTKGRDVPIVGVSFENRDGYNNSIMMMECPQGLGPSYLGQKFINRIDVTNIHGGANNYTRAHIFYF
jgi:hypothetical protein